MKRVYLDQNIWLDIQLKRFNCSLEGVLRNINRSKVEVVYSPANIEEICNSYCSPNIENKISIEERDFRLDMLSQVTQDRDSPLRQ